jgi:hypothetical protein
MHEKAADEGSAGDGEGVSSQEVEQYMRQRDLLAEQQKQLEHLHKLRDAQLAELERLKTLMRAEGATEADMAALVGNDDYEDVASQQDDTSSAPGHYDDADLDRSGELNTSTRTEDSEAPASLTTFITHILIRRARWLPPRPSTR